MSAAHLLYARLNEQVTSLGGRISPDIRRAGSALPVAVYELQQDAMLEVLGSPTPRLSVARCRIHILAETLDAANTIAQTAVDALHAHTWTASNFTAHMCVVVSSAQGVIDEALPDAHDLPREVVIDIDLTHSTT
jgi:hypothetical protein